MLPARKVEYQPYEVYRQKQHDEKMKRAAEHLQMKQARYQKKRRLSMLLNTTVCCLMVFGLLSLLVARYALIFEYNYTINNMKQTINELELKKQELRVACDSATTLENVKLVATRDLGMQYPKPEQVVYIASNWNYKLQGRYAAMDTTPPESDIMDGNVIEEISRYASALKFWINKMD